MSETASPVLTPVPRLGHKVLELFAGMGGGVIGDYMLGNQVVAVSEWEEDCHPILTKRIPGATIHGDIQDLDANQYRGLVDEVSGGWPCTSISLAGKQKGMAMHHEDEGSAQESTEEVDEIPEAILPAMTVEEYAVLTPEGRIQACKDGKFRPNFWHFAELPVAERKALIKTPSALAWEYLRVVKEARPKWVSGENVKNIIGKKHLPHLMEFLQVLTELGYGGSWCILSAEQVGAPHLRERFWLLGEYGLKGGFHRLDTSKIDSVPMKYVIPAGFSYPAEYETLTCKEFNERSRVVTTDAWGTPRVNGQGTHVYIRKDGKIRDDVETQVYMLAEGLTDEDVLKAGRNAFLTDKLAAESATVNLLARLLKEDEDPETLTTLHEVVTRYRGRFGVDEHMAAMNHVVLTHRTKENDQWTTPTSRDWKDTSCPPPYKDGKIRDDQLPRQVMLPEQCDMLWASEAVFDKLKVDVPSILTRMLGEKPWPTPSARELTTYDAEAIITRREACKAKGNNGNGFGLTVGNAIVLEESGAALVADGSAPHRPFKRTSDRVNPRWLELLMGFLVGWTDPDCAKPRMHLGTHGEWLWPRGRGFEQYAHEAPRLTPVVPKSKEAKRRNASIVGLGNAQVPHTKIAARRLLSEFNLRLIAQGTLQPTTLIAHGQEA